MLRNIFVVLSIIGCGIIIPVDLVAANGQQKGVSWLFKLTPQYMFGSQAFWAFVVVAYLFDIVICGFLWHNYRAVVRLRRNYFDSPEYQKSLHSRTLLLTDIPKDLRADDGIVTITEDVKGSNDTPRTAIARNVKDLPELVEEHEETVKALEAVLAKYLKHPDKLPEKRPTCKVSKKDKSYTKGQKVDAIEYLTSRIKELELEIKEVRETIDKRNALSYGFASYDSIPEAHSVAYVARKKGPGGTIIKLAPKPNDLVWKNLKMQKSERNWQNFINNLWVALLTLVWVAPNVMIAVFLANLGNLGSVWPAFDKELKAHPGWWAVVQAVLSPAITTAFYIFLPIIFRRLCMSAGDVTKTSRERHVMHKLYSFFVFNNLIVFSLFSTLFSYFATIIRAGTAKEDIWQTLEKQHPFRDAVSTLCQISPYWISWLLQRNQGAAVDLSQLVPLIWGSFSRKFLSPTPRHLIELSAPQPFDYAGYYNYFLFYATVAVCFGALQPLVLPVAAFYFWIDSFSKKYLLLYVFITKYESGGMFWRTLFNRCLVFALLGNVVIALLVVAQGYEGSNWGMLAALAPLPFLLGAFKWYCVRAFDDRIHYYQKGKVMNDAESTAGEHKKKTRDRVGVRFGHPVLYKRLITPMVSAKSQHLLKTIYSGRTSMDDDATVAGYSDVYMDAMEPNRPGKTKTDTPFEIVSEHHMDFAHFKDRPEFRDDIGEDLISRPGTPGGMTRAGTFDSLESRSRSQSRGPLGVYGRSDSADSERTKVGAEGGGGGVEYPRGYHQTPNLREQSPDSYSDAAAHRRVGSLQKESREGLVSSAARMGRSPPPQIPNPVGAGYGTPGSTPGEEEITSYDYFRRGRGL